MKSSHTSIFNLIEIFRKGSQKLAQKLAQKLNVQRHCSQHQLHDYYCDSKTI